MKTSHLIIPVLCAAFAVAACDRATSTPPPARAGATAVNSNPKVLDSRGFCNILVLSRYSGVEVDADKYQVPLDEAIAQFESAKASGAGQRALVLAAHRVRKLYFRLMHDWYKPMMEFTDGAFRCVIRSAGREELSSDDVFRKIPAYTAFIETLRGIPGKYDRPTSPERSR